MALKDRFETIIQCDDNRNEWNLIDFEDIKQENPEKNIEQAIDVMLDNIHNIIKLWIINIRMILYC